MIAHDGATWVTNWAGCLQVGYLLSCWAYACRFYGPDTILQECTPGFDSPYFAGILAQPKSLAPSTSSVFSICAPAPHTYDQDSLVFSPAELGVPASRIRFYARYNLETMVRRRHAAQLDFAGFFFCDRQASGFIDLVSDPHEEQDAMPPLTPAMQGRLESWYVSAQKNCYCADMGAQWSREVKLCICDISQNSDFGQLKTRGMPALLRKTMLYDMIRRRHLTHKGVLDDPGRPTSRRGRAQQGHKGTVPLCSFDIGTVVDCIAHAAATRSARQHDALVADWLVVHLQYDGHQAHCIKSHC